jgi:hypothetical protein
MKPGSLIQTRLYPGQGLGNQLWVYAATRGLSAYFGSQHQIVGDEFFKGSGFLDIDFGFDPSPALPVLEFREALFYDPNLQYFSSIFDNRVTTLTYRSRIEGLFQSEGYFFGHLNELSNWIRPSEKTTSLANAYKDVCVLNLRGGEYKRHKRFILPHSYWNMAINIARTKLGAEHFLIVTDDPAYARAFLPAYPVLQGGVEECYAALMGAKSIIVSNSSFSYFPIKTRKDRPFVIAPEHWARFGDPSKRWAMPSNVYEDWNYLSSDGRLLTSFECFESAAVDADYYQREFNIRVPSTMKLGSNINSIIPDFIKRPLKKILSHLFPKLIG